MADGVSYTDLLNEAAAKPRKPDPRLKALVRFLARRAAERDYERLLASRNAKDVSMTEKEQ